MAKYKLIEITVIEQLHNVWRAITSPSGVVVNQLFTGLHIVAEDGQEHYINSPYTVQYVGTKFTINDGCNCYTFTVADTLLTLGEIQGVVDNEVIPGSIYIQLTDYPVDIPGGLYDWDAAIADAVATGKTLYVQKLPVRYEVSSEITLSAPITIESNSAEINFSHVTETCFYIAPMAIGVTLTGLHLYHTTADPTLNTSSGIFCDELRTTIENCHILYFSVGINSPASEAQIISTKIEYAINGIICNLNARVNKCELYDIYNIGIESTNRAIITDNRIYSFDTGIKLLNDHNIAMGNIIGADITPIQNLGANNVVANNVIV